MLVSSNEVVAGSFGSGVGAVRLVRMFFCGGGWSGPSEP
jgi:hypothetical protein